MASAEGKPEVNFTVRDLELFAQCVKCLKGGEFAVDYQKLAELGGYKNANSSKAAFHGLKKKLDKFGSGTVAGNGPSLSIGGSDDKGTPASGKKRKTPSKNQDDDENGEEETPAKKKGRKPRATPKSKAVVAGADDVEDDPEASMIKSEDAEEGEGEATPAKKGRKPAAKGKKAAPAAAAAATAEEESDAKEDSAEAQVKDEERVEETGEGQETGEAQEAGEVQEAAGVKKESEEA